MPYRIEVAIRSDLTDSLGNRICKKIKNDLGLELNQVKTVKVYLIEAVLEQDQLEQAAGSLLSDPVLHTASFDKPVATMLEWDWIIEVGFKPGVTDNEGKVAGEAIRYQTGKQDIKAYSSIQYCLSGHLTRKDIQAIAYGVLANELIQRVGIFERNEFERLWQDQPGIFYVLPDVKGHEARIDSIVLKGLDDNELAQLSKDRLLALNLTELHSIRDYFTNSEVAARRLAHGLSSDPTDVELEALAQSWSEHCKHKIFNALIEYEDAERGETIQFDSLFDTCIKKATADIRKRLGANDWCVSVFKDNAGVISFNEKYNVAFKVETHNSPSALDPYGGALTGIVGVNRDPFGTGLGASLIFNTDVFCFGPPDYKINLPKGLLHPHRIFEGVREGVEHGGNQMGIPTVNGSIVFDERFVGKPLVFCGTGGLMPKQVAGRPSHEKQAKPGDFIVMCGGRIGKDGIHGATFSSEELHEGSPATAVQIGDPITQKKMFDFLLRVRDLGLYSSITDNGAGGLSSSVGEMAQETGGFELHLDKAPLKYPGLHPWEILLSEAQERMTVAVPPSHIEAFMTIAKEMDVEATVMGTFTSTGLFHCLYQGKTVALLEMDFVHNGTPQLKLKARWSPPRYPEPVYGDDETEVTGVLNALLGRYNIASKEYVVRQYDHEVQARTVIKPLTGANNDGPSDAAVIRIALDSYEGLVVAHGICPRYSDIDTWHMAACAVDEAVRNALCVGADIKLMAGLDNFCWCDPVQSEKNPDGEYKLAQLVRANQALYEICTAYGVPCISGKDSMKNDAIIEGVKISIPPTMLFSVISRIPDIRKAVTMDFKAQGDLIYMLGNTYDETGGSEFFAMNGYVGNKVPRVRIQANLACYERLSQAITARLIASCHDCSDGGLLVTLAESAFAGDIGAEVNLDNIPTGESMPLLSLLTSESQGRFIVSVPPCHEAEFKAIFDGIPNGCIGFVTGRNKLILKRAGKILTEQDVNELKNHWKKPLAFDA